MPKFFRFPWASTGDKTTIPDETDVAGFVSYQQGYGNDYARDPASDPLAKLIERDKMNQLYSDLTENAQYWQTHAFPEYITAAQNGGVAYAYDVDAIVRYNDGGGYKVYQNQTAGNTNLPTGAGWVKYNIASLINAATLKATPVDSDVFGIADSAASFVLKKLTWANVKATILSSFGVMINTATAKTTPVDADIFIIADSAATNASKKLTWANIKTALTSVFAPTNSPTFTGTVSLDTNATLVFEGSTADAYETTITVVNPTADRTLSLPNESGTLATREYIPTVFNATGNAPMYACRAWVNFDGTGTVAIRASGNVSSITDNGVGVYTVNFTNAIIDANYNVVGTRSNIVNGSAAAVHVSTDIAPTPSLVKVVSSIGADIPSDSSMVNVSIFR